MMIDMGYLRDAMQYRQAVLDAGMMGAIRDLEREIEAQPVLTAIKTSRIVSVEYSNDPDLNRSVAATIIQEDGTETVSSTDASRGLVVPFAGLVLVETVNGSYPFKWVAGDIGSTVYVPASRVKWTWNLLGLEFPHENCDARGFLIGPVIQHAGATPTLPGAITLSDNFTLIDYKGRFGGWQVDYDIAGSTLQSALERIFGVAAFSAATPSSEGSGTYALGTPQGISFSRCLRTTGDGEFQYDGGIIRFPLEVGTHEEAQRIGVYLNPPAPTSQLWIPVPGSVVDDPDNTGVVSTEGTAQYYGLSIADPAGVFRAPPTAPGIRSVNYLSILFTPTTTGTVLGSSEIRRVTFLWGNGKTLHLRGMGNTLTQDQRYRIEHNQGLQKLKHLIFSGTKHVSKSTAISSKVIQHPKVDQFNSAFDNDSAAPWYLHDISGDVVDGEWKLFFDVGYPFGFSRGSWEHQDYGHMDPPGGTSIREGKLQVVSPPVHFQQIAAGNLRGLSTMERNLEYNFARYSLQMNTYLVSFMRAIKTLNLQAYFTEKRILYLDDTTNRVVINIRLLSQTINDLAHQVEDLSGNVSSAQDANGDVDFGSEAFFDEALPVFLGVVGGVIGLAIGNPVLGVLVGSMIAQSIVGAREGLEDVQQGRTVDGGFKLASSILMIAAASQMHGSSAKLDAVAEEVQLTKETVSAVVDTSAMTAEEKEAFTKDTPSVFSRADEAVNKLKKWKENGLIKRSLYSFANAHFPLDATLETASTGIQVADAGFKAVDTLVRGTPSQGRAVITDVLEQNGINVNKKGSLISSVVDFAQADPVTRQEVYDTAENLVNTTEQVQIIQDRFTNGGVIGIAQDVATAKTSSFIASTRDYLLGWAEIPRSFYYLF
jgi:hypothetical protein